jgi:RNA polymerase sigma factor (sigma-70 family)
MPLLGSNLATSEASRSDDYLVKECLKGNEAAWSSLVQKYKNLIFSIPIKYGFDADEADEIFQDVCLALLSELHRLRHPQALAGWLIQTTAHRCFHWKRQRGRYVTAESETTFSALRTGANQEALMHEAEKEQMIRTALSELPSRCNELVQMLFFEEPSVPYEQIAQKLALAKGSIGFIRMRCLERLRQSLEKKGFR